MNLRAANGLERKSLVLIGVYMNYIERQNKNPDRLIIGFMLESGYLY